MRVLITGASGFIGWPVVQNLLDENHKVMALSRKMLIKSDCLDIKWIEADLSDPMTYGDQISSFAPEVVIHLAWQGIPDYSYEMSRLNLEQSLDLLSFVVGLGSCQKILITGSCWEYNRNDGACLETEASFPKNDFTWAKHALRSWMELECLRKSICFGWLRLFYVYGPRQRESSLIPSIIINLMEGTIPKIQNPSNSNDFVFIDDVVQAISLAVNREFSNGIYNLGSGVATSVTEVCRIAERIINGSEMLTLQIETEISDTKRNMNFWADHSCSTKELGWSPTTNIEEGIKNTWQWMKKN